MDFEPDDSITYRTFERAFDTHPVECSSSTVCTVEECSPSTVVAGRDDDDCQIASAESDHNADPEIDKIDDLEVEDIGEDNDGAEERKKNVEVEEEEEESKTDEEREEEICKEERRKVVAESMILYTAQLRSLKEKEEKEKEHDTDNAKELEGEERSEIGITATTEVEDDDRDDDKEGVKVEKEGAPCNSMSCISTMSLPYLLDITSSIVCRVSHSLVFHLTIFAQYLSFSFLCSLFLILSPPPLPFSTLSISSLSPLPLPFFFFASFVCPLSLSLSLSIFFFFPIPSLFHFLLNRFPN
jgi:hypothetical protein